MPKSRLELALTLARFAFRDKSVVLLTQGLGDQPFHGRIAILVNEWTNSAAEMVAAFGIPEPAGAYHRQPDGWQCSRRHEF